MTAQPTPTPPPAPRRATPRRSNRTRPGALAVYATTAALFVTTFGFLGLRVAQGQDPAINAQTTQTTRTTAATTTVASVRAIAQTSSPTPVQTATS